MFDDFQTDMRPALSSIQVPALMLYPFDSSSKHGDKTAAQEVDELYQHTYRPMRNVKMVRVDGSRHYIMLDQPKQFHLLVKSL